MASSRIRASSRSLRVAPSCRPWWTRCSAAASSGRFADDPAALADITIYVPNRRAARALIALLAERGGGRAQLLPRIVPLGETDEAEFELTGLEARRCRRPRA